MVTDIAAGVREILAFHLGSDRAKIANDARLVDDLGADSLDVVEIVMSCEERFNIDIPNDVATKFVTVGDAVDFIDMQSRSGQAIRARLSPASTAPRARLDLLLPYQVMRRPAVSAWLESCPAMVPS